MKPIDGRPRPSRREVWDERHATGAPIESAEPDPTLIEEVAGLRPGRALDLGAGDGRNAVWLAANGWRVTAVDFSEVGLERGRVLAEQHGVEVEWVLADLLDWSPQADQFDLVTLFFIHLPPEERRRIYAGAATAVAPGGTLLIVAHDLANLTEGVGGPQDPGVLFTPAEISAELAGFAVRRAETVRRSSPNGAGPIDAVWCGLKQASE